MKKTIAKKQSYIQVKEGSKWKLLVSCSELQAHKAGKEHKEVINLLWDKAQALSKTELVDMRNNILKPAEDVE